VYGVDGCAPAIHFVPHLSAKVVNEPLAVRWKSDPAAISAVALNEGANFRRKPSGRIHSLPEVSRSPPGDLPARILGAGRASYFDDDVSNEIMPNNVIRDDVQVLINFPRAKLNSSPSKVKQTCERVKINKTRSHKQKRVSQHFALR